MLLDRVQIFLSRLRQRAQQSYEFTPGEALSSDGDYLTDWHAASFHDESLVSISHTVYDFGKSPRCIGGRDF